MPAGSPDIEVDFLPSVRAGLDKCQCVEGGPDLINQGCGTVFFNDMPAVRKGDMTVHGGVIAAGSSSVEIGVVGDAVEFHAESAGSVGGKKGKQGKEGNSNNPSQPREQTRESEGECYAKFVVEGEPYVGKKKFAGKRRGEFSFRCMSWDPDTGGSGQSPNPQAMQIRKWELRKAGSTILSIGLGDGPIVWVPELGGKAAWPPNTPFQEVEVVLEITDAQGHWSKATQMIRVYRSPPLRFALFFGGAMDEWGGQFVKGSYRSFHYPLTPDLVWYFPWDNESSALDFIGELQTETDDVIIALIGHSYGGDTAWDVARSTSAIVNCLVTVDPASQFRPQIPGKPSRVSFWHNIWVRGWSSKNDTIADIGGAWEQVSAADINSTYDSGQAIEGSEIDHASFAILFRHSGARDRVAAGLGWS